MSINFYWGKSGYQIYPESCLVMRQYRIEWLIFYMETKKGLERVKVVAEYQAKAKEYNNIVGFKCYDVNYDPLNIPVPQPAEITEPNQSASNSIMAFIKPKPKIS